ncbi:MAG: hypothetical protein AAF633_12695 [Chloroflexota bacterium]
MRTQDRIKIDNTETTERPSSSLQDVTRNSNGSFLTVPLSQRGVPKFIVYLLSLIGFVYIINPGFGLIELIPDITPIVGNLDEGGAFMLLWYGLIEFFDGRRRRRDQA